MKKEEVIRKLQKQKAEYLEEWVDYSGVAEAFDMAIKSLSSDSVDVVYCKDCKWYEDPRRKIFENCVRGGRIIPMKPTDYCSYGKRREE